MPSISIRLASVIFGASVLLAGAAHAQTAPAAPETVPEELPFDIPYGPSITVAHAQKVAMAAEAECRKHKWKMAISIVDPAGNLVYFWKMDGTQTASITIAEHKARVAATFRRPTKCSRTSSPRTISILRRSMASSARAAAFRWWRTARSSAPSASAAAPDRRTSPAPRPAPTQ